MGLETGTYINDLVTTNPVGATDQKQFGDDHLRLIKSVLKATFPGMAGAFARVATKTGNYTVVVNDNTTMFNCTAALTLAWTAVATLGNGHIAAVFANGADVIIDPNGAELVNGAATLTVKNGQFAIVYCTGTALLAFVGGDFSSNGSVPMTGAVNTARATVTGHATDTPIWAAAGNEVAVTGTPDITDFPDAPQAGASRVLYPAAGTIFRNNANIAVQGAADYTAAAGDIVTVHAITTSTFRAEIEKADGTAVVGIPAGAVIYVAMSTAPVGWLKANGAAISRTTYAALYAAIGTTYGAGDGSTTFNVPDLRGEFLRGLDDGRGVDSGRGIGTAQADEFKSHTHNTGTASTVANGTWGIYTAGSDTQSITGSTGGTETRPRNVAMLACIKF